VRDDDERCGSSLLSPVLFSSVFIQAEMFVDGYQALEAAEALAHFYDQEGNITATDSQF
jgi:hypothetical protein